MATGHIVLNELPLYGPLVSCVFLLTALSMPSMIRVMKKRNDQICDPGKVAIASG